MIAALNHVLWSMLAWALAQPTVADWCIRRAKRTPYSPIVKNGQLYMDRWWLFNPYPDTGGSGADRPRWQFPISIRIHHILLPDQDRHLHDHPWNARTVILRGWYAEERSDDDFFRWTGDTAKLNFGEFHRITRISHGGCYTLFITGPYRGTWGFLVDGVKVQWRKYLGIPDKANGATENIEPVAETDYPLRRRVFLAIIATYCLAGVGACALIYFGGVP